jgi:lipopolysaccharide export system protein LptA
MRKAIIAALAGLPVALGEASAQLIADSDEPIDITGDSLEVIDDVATWIGNVSAVQGEAVLTAERLIARLDGKGSFTSIEAVGAVRYSNGKEAITGEAALYQAGPRSIIVSRNVVVTQGETVMTGGSLVYWLDTGRIRFTASDGERIRGIFHAKSGGEIR